MLNWEILRKNIKKNFLNYLSLHIIYSQRKKRLKKGLRGA